MPDVNSDRESAIKRGKPKKEVKPFSNEETEKLINLWDELKGRSNVALPHPLIKGYLWALRGESQSCKEVL